MYGLGVGHAISAGISGGGPGGSAILGGEDVILVSGGILGVIGAIHRQVTKIVAEEEWVIRAAGSQHIREQSRGSGRVGQSDALPGLTPIAALEQQDSCSHPMPVLLQLMIPLLSLYGSSRRSQVKPLSLLR